MRSTLSTPHNPILPSPLAQRIAEVFKLEPQPTIQATPDNRPASKPAQPKASLFDRIDAWFWRQEQKELEAWLAQSRSVFELERRIRHIGHGAGMRYW